MSIIEVHGLVREFRTPRRQPGLFGGLRTLLSREYNVTRAVDGISFSVDEGELVGYIGPNGAGKSTTIKVLTGIMSPDAGTVQVAGLVPWRQRDQNATNMGVIFGQRSQLWWDLPLVESFKLVAKMYRVPEATYRRNMERFAALLGLEEFINTPVRQLSLGQRMRGDLVAAMLYEPRILYLDEPTIGLDVLAKERIRAFLEELNRAGHTSIVLTTHDMHDIERLCRRIILIDHGHILYDGSLDQFNRRYAPHRVLVIHLAQDGATIEAPGTEQVRQEGSKVWLRFEPERVPAAELISSITARHPITDLSIEEPELEQIIRQNYEEREDEQTKKATR